MSEHTFLIEIGTEELPPKFLRNLAESFAANLTTELNKAFLHYEEVMWFATPRRLALKVINLSDFQLNRTIEKRGPSIIQAFDDKGNASRAAEKWAISCGITISQAQRLTTDKGEWLLYRANVKGKSSKILLPNIVKISLAKLSITKLMRWGESNVSFVRPVHTVTLLLDNQVITEKILGINSDQIILGHRFMGEKKIVINNANQYPQILLDRGRVIANYEQRKAKIKSDIEEAANKINGNVDLSDDSLLEEVTSLVEWPVVLMANFEKKFLSIPSEILVHILKVKQKYFPIYSKDGKLLPIFIFVVNIESKDSQQIISGNEMVMHARLTDAEFFFNMDRKKRLEDYLPCLRRIFFHQKLGTLYDKTERMQLLSSWIAKQIGADIKHAVRTGLLSQCDMMTNLVLEFAETKGIVGMYYARYDKENEDVAIALNEQYYPRFSNDHLPSNLISCTVAIAEKIDILVGIFGIGYHPKGDKDPFALRRAALGLLRIMIEKKLNLDLQTLAEKSMHLYGNKIIKNTVINDVIDFILARLCAWYKNKGYGIDIIQSVLARRPTCPVDFDTRLQAMLRFRRLESFDSIIVTNKRIANILAKSNEPLNKLVYTHFLREWNEIKLVENMETLREKLQICFNESRYYDALSKLSTLCNPINEFLEKVKVNVVDKDIRINRLTLLSKLHELFLRIADISLLK